MTGICKKRQIVAFHNALDMSGKIDFSWQHTPEGSGQAISLCVLIPMTCFCERLDTKRFLPLVEMTRSTLAEEGEGNRVRSTRFPSPHINPWTWSFRPKTAAKQVLPGEIYFIMSCPPFNSTPTNLSPQKSAVPHVREDVCPATCASTLCKKLSLEAPNEKTCFF